MISVNMVDANVYEVVVEGEKETVHRVAMSQAFYRELCGMTVTHEFVLIQSFRYLLDTVPSGEIPEEFDLEDTAAAHPDFVETVRTRLMR